MEIVYIYRMRGEQTAGRSRIDYMIGKQGCGSPLGGQERLYEGVFDVVVRYLCESGFGVCTFTTSSYGSSRWSFGAWDRIPTFLDV
jgi:hypothetical protein